jgi:hypothetical protein
LKLIQRSISVFGSLSINQPSEHGLHRLPYQLATAA